MKNFKNFCKSNRVFVVLMAVVLICIIISGLSLINYFYGGKKSDNYGSRLEGIEEVEITEERKEDVENKLTEDEQIKKAEIIVTGKIIYIKMEFDPNVSLVEAEGKASVVLDEFNEEEKSFYDFQFTLKQDKTEESEGFVIAGAKNVNGTNIMWTNNNEPEENTENETK